MSCEDCEKFQEEDWVYWFRWGIADIGILACEKHFMEIREVLKDMAKKGKRGEENNGQNEG